MRAANDLVWAGGAATPCPAQVRGNATSPSCLVLDRLPVSTCFVDHTLRVQYVNRRLGEVTGETSDEILGTPVLDRVHPGDRARVRAHLLGAGRSPGTIWPATFRYRAAHAWHLASSQAVAYPESPWGEGILCLIESHDVAADDPGPAPGPAGWEGALIFGPGDDVWVTGSALREATGLPRELPRRRLLDLFPDPVPLERALAGEPVAEEVLTWEPDGGRAPVQVELTTGRVPGAAEDVVVVRVRDVTRERSLLSELTDALRVAEEMEEDRRLRLAWAAHELRSPLGAVMALGQLIHEGNLGDHDLGMLAGRIVENARQSLRVLDELLDGGPADEPGAGAGADVAACARAVVAAVQADVRPGVAVEVDVAEPAPRVAMTAHALRSVLRRLVENAAAHTAAGRITVTAEAGAGGHVAVEVADTGTGFAASPRHRTPARPGAHGLGLWVAETLVRRAGGELRIDSAPGAGTRVSALLPAAR